MQSKFSIYIGVAVMLATLTGCAMLGMGKKDNPVEEVTALEKKPIWRGQILATAGDQVYLYLDDGAQAGQLFTVYKFVKTSPAKSKPKAEFPPTFQRQPTGTVQTTELVADYFAKGKIVSGKAEVHSVVEMNP